MWQTGLIYATRLKKRRKNTVSPLCTIEESRKSNPLVERVGALPPRRMKAKATPRRRVPATQKGER